MKLLPELMRFVQLTSAKYNIDESHAVGHSMKVLLNAHQIYSNSVHTYPYLKSQEPVIYTAAIVHDMCDKKYMNQTDGIREINKILNHRLDYSEIVFINKIVSTMSYSTVKKNGFPLLGKFQMAYHIVREADLLAAYDFDRSLIYHMYHSGEGFEKSYDNALELFENRVLKHHTDNLFVTEYSKKKGYEMYYDALSQMNAWKYIINSYDKHSSVPL
jgi:hypothetical protein